MRADRRSALVPFAVIGTGCVVAGGLVSAATAPTPTVHAAWAVAYVVLVAGVAQVALGFGQAVLAPQVPSRRRVAAELAGWNGGNAAVLVGTLTGVTPLVDSGGVVLVVTLVSLVVAVRGADRRDGRPWGPWPLYGFRLLVLVLLVSIPIGLLLARIGPR